MTSLFLWVVSCIKSFDIDEINTLLLLIACLISLCANVLLLWFPTSVDILLLTSIIACLISLCEVLLILWDSIAGAILLLTDVTDCLISLWDDVLLLCWFTFDVTNLVVATLVSFEEVSGVTDCGIEIKVKVKDTRTCRCEDCQKNFELDSGRIRSQKFRDNHKA